MHWTPAHPPNLPLITAAINKAEFEQSILIPMKEDGLDEYRKEYNEMLLSKISDTNNSILRERYLTISVHKKNIDEARTYFARVGTDITTHLAKLSSIGEELDAGERLKIFRDFFKEDVSATAEFDFKEAVKRGHDFKDWFAPDSMEFLQDHFKIDGRYGACFVYAGLCNLRPGQHGIGTL